MQALRFRDLVLRFWGGGGGGGERGGRGEGGGGRVLALGFGAQVLGVYGLKLLHGRCLPTEPQDPRPSMPKPTTPKPKAPETHAPKSKPIK